MQRSRLRSKLLRIMVGILLLVGVGTLSAVAWMNYQSAIKQRKTLEAQISAGIASKSNVLIESHALALRGLAADNAFSDIQQLVHRNVKNDPDVIYGVFLNAQGKAWAYSAPTTLGLKPSEALELDPVKQLEIDPRTLTQGVPSNRALELFGKRIREVSHPVLEEGELLGTIRYGFSTDKLEAALAEARESSSNALREMLSFIAAIVLLNTVLGFLIVGRASDRITKPLSELTKAANQIAAGEREVRVNVKSGDELEVLSDAFNHMQVANEEAFTMLEEKTRQALEASRLKSEFLANMSHEIRTPMNGVIGMTRLILNMPLEGKLRRYAETVDASASALLTIINDVLDFSKMEAGKYTLQSVVYDPAIVLGEVAELFAGRAYDKGLELVYRTVPGAPAAVVGDPDRFRQILNNLVGNAVKFTDHGDVFVELSVDSKDDDGVILRVVVQDSGIGIAKEHLDVLFEAFSQVDGSSVRQHGGTGLGLTISKRLVHMMGGEIGVESERGIGSKFWFTVRTEEAKASDSQFEPFPTGKHAMVVEANRRWGSIIAEHMEVWGLTCSRFERGDEALKSFAEKPNPQSPDVMVVGAQLRDMDIEQFVRKLRMLPNGKQVSLIVLTQLGSSATLTEVEKEVAAQLSKPLRLSDLYDCLLRTFGKSPKRVQARKRRERAAQAGKSLRILVVDDNEINQYVAVEQLNEAGYEADVASNGKEAVEKVRGGHYDAVLMDCQMPVMDGYTATREIRKFELGNQHTPIIALTAHAMLGERDKVLAAGMDDYLSKPLKPNTLERMLSRYVRAGASVPPEQPSRPSLAGSSLLDPDIPRSRRLVEVFLRKLPEHIEELAQAVASQSAPKVREKAHKIKGSCLALGATSMGEMAEDLQKRSEQGDLSTAEQTLSQLRTQFEQVTELLQKELNGDTESAPSQQPASHPPPGA